MSRTKANNSHLSVMPSFGGSQSTSQSIGLSKTTAIIIVTMCPCAVTLYPVSLHKKSAYTLIDTIAEESETPVFPESP